MFKINGRKHDVRMAWQFNNILHEITSADRESVQNKIND